MLSKRGSLLSEAVRAELHSAVATAPKTQPESLLESVGIPGCTCREPRIPCVCTRLIALEKEAIFIPKHAVVQVKSTEITIPVVFSLLSFAKVCLHLTACLGKFYCLWCPVGLQCPTERCLLQKWLEFAPRCHFSLCHVSQVPLFIKAGFWQRSCWPEVEPSSAAQEWSRSSGSLIPWGSSHRLPLTHCRTLDPSAAPALACGAASGFWGRVSRLDQSIVSGLHVIWKCQPYLFQAWIKGFAIAIC